MCNCPLLISCKCKYSSSSFLNIIVLYSLGNVVGLTIILMTHSSIIQWHILMTQVDDTHNITFIMYHSFPVVFHSLNVECTVDWMCVDWLHVWKKCTAMQGVKRGNRRKGLNANDKGKNGRKGVNSMGTADQRITVRSDAVVTTRMIGSKQILDMLDN